ncbi:MAG: Asp-tRNA(Asn)/Glu-tRNA(Gln) amidotransferase subunit GatB [Fimbriimonadaceae bacterium]|nr:Asp-tRNA(Asn)/Glu-tRNA(Gln) amidotransferase subunit GatB [Fimbriimonadaceae bacterium]
MQTWIPSVGIEVHAELNTESKMFCRCPVAFGGEPNTRTCPVCLGLPGALPVPNKAAIEKVLRTALALNCKIAMDSFFHRKNYFYPDLSKGYQISQYGETNPLGYYGYLEIPTPDGGTKKIRIRRVHLEEDTGKLLHLPTGGSGVDFNRSGVPLMEVVTDFPPDVSSSDEAKEYLVQLRQLLLYLDVCDGKMEEGSLRCEPNISVRKADSETYGTKTELKNLGSFRAMQLGVQYEVKRQTALLEAGEAIKQETRGWNEAKEASYLMRVKEQENDYRYFPDPDLVPMKFDEEYIESLRKSIPELPLTKQLRYQRDYGFEAKEAAELVADKAWAAYFEDCVQAGGEAKTVSNWMRSDFAKLLNETGLSPRQSKVSPAHLVDLTKLIAAGEISGKMAKEMFAEVFESGKMPTEILRASGKSMITDRGVIEALCAKVLSENQGPVEKYKAGQTNVIGFFVGQVMKMSQGQAKPDLVQEIVREALDKQ